MTRSSEASAAVALPDLEDNELGAMLNGLSTESKAFVKILKLVITKQFKTELEVIKEEIVKKGTEITNLKTEIKDLKDQIHSFETHTDNTEQYEHNDTVVISGPSLPTKTAQENTKSVVVTTFRDHLKINIKDEGISVAYRLGPAHHSKNRPMTVKLVNRSLKHDLLGACINLKPTLYINKNFTPKRTYIMKKVLAVRKIHKQKFKQYYTKDEKIVVELQNSTVRHTIIEDQSLIVFLDKYPAMMDTY